LNSIKRAVIILPPEAAAWTTYAAAFLLQRGWRVCFQTSAADATHLPVADVLIMTEAAEDTPLPQHERRLYPTHWDEFTAQLAALPSSNRP
jgi:hypothetical protein